jgi:hypothetical protein
MTKYTRYSIVMELTMKEFLKKCNERLEFGWVPQGGISYLRENGTYFTQAFVTTKEENNV